MWASRYVAQQPYQESTLTRGQVIRGTGERRPRTLALLEEELAAARAEAARALALASGLAQRKASAGASRAAHLSQEPPFAPGECAAYDAVQERIENLRTEIALLVRERQTMGPYTALDF